MASGQCPWRASVMPTLSQASAESGWSLERRAKPVECLVELAQVGEGDTQVHPRIERVGLNLEGPPVEHDGAIRPPLVPKGDSQVVQDPEVLGLELVCAEVIGHGLGRAALLPDGGAQIVEHVGVVGIEAECFTKAGLGFGEASLSEQRCALKEVIPGRGIELRSAASCGACRVAIRTWMSPDMGLAPSRPVSRLEARRFARGCVGRSRRPSMWGWPRVKRDWPTLPSPISVDRGGLPGACRTGRPEHTLAPSRVEPHHRVEVEEHDAGRASAQAHCIGGVCFHEVDLWCSCWSP